MSVEANSNITVSNPLVFNSSEKVTLPNINNRTDDLVTIKLQEAGKQSKLSKSLKNRVTLYNDLGADVKSFKINEQIEGAYQRLRTSVVAFVYSKSLEAPQNAKEVHFNLSKMSVLIKYENGTEETLDLQALVEDEDNPQFKQQYESLEALVRPIWGGTTRGEYVEKGRKSSSKGEQAMQRGNHVVLNSLPTEHAKCLDVAKSLLESSLQPEVKEKGLQEAEGRINALAKAIDSQLVTVRSDLQREEAALQVLVQERNGQNAGVDIDKRIKVSSDKVKKLKNLESQLNDRLGLYVAVAFMPVSTFGLSESQKLKMIVNAAVAAQNALHSYIDKESEPFKNEGVNTTWPEFLPGFIRGKPKTIPDCKDFCIDVAALIFSSLPVGLARMGALDFWTKQRSSPKSECLADELIRFAFGDGETVSMLDEIESTAAVKSSLSLLKSETKTIFSKVVQDQDFKIHLESLNDSGSSRDKSPIEDPRKSKGDLHEVIIEDLPLYGEPGYIEEENLT